MAIEDSDLRSAVNWLAVASREASDASKIPVDAMRSLLTDDDGNPAAMRGEVEEFIKRLTKALHLAIEVKVRLMNAGEAFELKKRESE